jgi:hypothetical protein
MKTDHHINLCQHIGVVLAQPLPTHAREHKDVSAMALTPPSEQPCQGFWLLEGLTTGNREAIGLLKPGLNRGGELAEGALATIRLPSVMADAARTLQGTALHP